MNEGATEYPDEEDRPSFWTILGPREPHRGAGEQGAADRASSALPSAGGSDRGSGPGRRAGPAPLLRACVCGGGVTALLPRPVLGGDTAQAISGA